MKYCITIICENKNPGLDTDFHNQQLDFPTVTICPLVPYNLTILNETAYVYVGGHENSSYLNAPLLEIISKLSYDNINEAAELVKQIPAGMVR